MGQFLFGLALLLGLMLPPVAELMESIMIVHMHMQMPMLVIAGFFMARLIQDKFPRFFEKYNQNGVPGILLFTIIMCYWMLPRTMDEALTIPIVEAFKFISLPFLAGIPLRDSWKKLSARLKNGVIILFTFLFLMLGWLYIQTNAQLCNNYLVIDQVILGWGFMTMAICMVIYIAYIFLVDPSQYE
jgi:amino acid transporter